VAQTTFGTAINCIDGRAQLPVIAWVREMVSLDYVDMITEPGADGLLALRPAAAEQLVRPKVTLSLERHASPIVVIAAHYDCLGNPVTEAEHREHLKRAIDLLQSWHLGVKIMALWVNETGQVDVVLTRGA
jgi:hypothetical protein